MTTNGTRPDEEARRLEFHRELRVKRVVLILGAMALSAALGLLVGALALRWGH